MSLAAEESASEQARAIAFTSLADLRTWLLAVHPSDAADHAHLTYAAQQIKRFADNPKQIDLSKPVDPPDGSPIGSDWEP
jgi:hypothetical protein